MSAKNNKKKKTEKKSKKKLNKTKQNTNQKKSFFFFFKKNKNTIQQAIEGVEGNISQHTHTFKYNVANEIVIPSVC